MQPSQSSPLERRSLPDLVPDQELSPTVASSSLLNASPSESTLNQSSKNRLPTRPRTPADIAIDILPIAENSERRHIQVTLRI